MGWKESPPTSSGGSAGSTPAWMTSAPVSQAPQQESRSALRGAESIGATPWYSQPLGKLVGMPGRGPTVMDVLGVLPTAGGLAGGVVGGTGGTAFGLGFGGVPGAIGGASLGGGAGEAARQNILRAIGGPTARTGEEAATNIAKEAAMQAAGEAGGRLVGKGLTRTVAPFAKSIDQPVVEAAQRQGVSMPASALSTSKVPPLLETTAAKGFGGGAITERIANTNADLMRIADDTVRRASNFSGPSEAGKAVAEGAARYKAAFRQQKARLYKEAALPERGLRFQASQTVGVLEEIIKNKESAGAILTEGPTADASFYRGLLGGLTRTVKGPAGKPVRVLRDVEASDVLNAKRELQQKIAASFGDPMSTANKASLKKIAATMDEELRAAIEAQNPELAAKLRLADMAYAEGIGKINSAFGESIHRLAKDGQYDKISKAVANSKMSVDDIPKIMEVAGREGTDGIRATVLADMFAKAKSPTGEGFKPLALRRQMQTFGEDRLQALLTPEQFAQLQDLGTLTASMQKAAKIAEGSQTAYLLRYKGHPGLVALRVVLGDVPFNTFIASKAGQRWLTTGLQLPPSTAKAITAGAHAGTVPFTPQYEEE